MVLCDVAAKQIGRDGNVSEYVRFVIEVKRGTAPNSEINSDMLRLHNYLATAQNGARAFLFVVSENSVPSRFVKDGKSWLGAHQISNCSGNFGVRRTVVLQKGKKGNIARNVAIYLSREMTGESGVALGRYFGISGAGVTIRHGIVAEIITKDRTLNRQVNKIKKAIINN